MSVSLPSYVEDLGHGVYAIDTGFHGDRFDAAYLIARGGRGLFVDSGTNFSVPRLLGALEAVGVAREAVDHVIPTHVHLDHAGGMGLLMQHLPNATMLVHPRGARHLIDPSALVVGATAVYGPEEMARSYGTLVGAPQERVQSTHDGQVLRWQGADLLFADTPGHARHHHCIWDEASRGWFTGDTFGLSYREFDNERGAWIMPTTTPVQFEPEPLKASIGRLMQTDPERMYLTHYGCVSGVRRLATQLLQLIDALVSLALPLRSLPATERHAALVAGQRVLLRDSLLTHGWDAPFVDAQLDGLLDLDIGLNAQGLAVWLDRLPATA